MLLACADPTQLTTRSQKLGFQRDCRQPRSDSALLSAPLPEPQELRGNSPNQAKKETKG